MKKAPLIIFLSFIFTTVLVSNLSADKVHLFNANPEKNSIHSTSYTNSDLEENDPPVIIAPVGEITARSAQFYNFIWQPRHTSATLIRYELMIYEKVKGLSDDQIINVTPPLFRTTTIANSYLYTPADPILKMNQEYIVMVQVNSLKGNVSFKNNGKSRIETFKIIPSCIPGDTCDDGQDCTYDDRIVLDCECKGTPYYDSNNDGVCDELLLPAPEIYAPELSEVKVDGKDFTTRWKKKHKFELNIDYRVDVLQTGVDATNTTVYQDLSKRLKTERKEFLEQQKEQKVKFDNKQQKAVADFNEELNTLNEECTSAFVQNQEAFDEQQAVNNNGFDESLNAIMSNCPGDQGAAKAIFESQLKKEQEDFKDTQAKELALFNERMSKTLAEFEEQAKGEKSDFLIGQKEELDAFLIQLEIEKNETCGTQETFEQSFESEKAELKKARENCTEEADDYKNRVKREAKETLKNIKEEIEVVKLARELGEAKHKELLSQLEADLKKNLKNASSEEQELQIQKAHDEAIALAKENHLNILNTLDEKIAEYKNEQTLVKEKRAADLADAESTIKKLNRECRAEYRIGLEALEANLTTAEKALESCLASIEQDAILFTNQQKDALSKFDQQQVKDAQLFKDEQKKKEKEFLATQKEALDLLNKSHEERRAAFVKDWPNCEQLIANQQELYEAQQTEILPYLLNEIQEQIVDCLNKGGQLEEGFKQQQLEEKQLFEKEQISELARFDSQQSRQKEDLQTAVRTGGAKKVIYTTHTTNLSQTIASSDCRLKAGYQYVIQVTAKELNGVARFENRGLSNEWPLVMKGDNNITDGKGEEINVTDNARTECEIPIAICPTERTVAVCDYTLDLPFDANSACRNRFLLVQEPGGGSFWIYQSSPIGQQFFNWDYCANTSTCSLTPLSTFATDLQNWLDQSGHIGTVTYANGVGTESDQISISGTDVRFYYLYKSCGSVATYQSFIQSNCQNETVYDLYPQGTDDCQNPVYEWSTGQSTPYITVSDLDGGDYNVTVTCSNGCFYYVSQEKLPCDDGDECTINDGLDADCNCIGIYEDSDGDGVCNPLDICEGHDDNIDENGDGIPDGCGECEDVGLPCDDGNPCTVIDQIDESCNCIGELVGDWDEDGICDPIDICHGGDDNLDSDGDGVPDFCDDCAEGAPCDDGNPLTLYDVWMINPDIIPNHPPAPGVEYCICVGTPIEDVDCDLDSDNDGVCDDIDECEGFNDFIDSDADGVPDGCDVCPNANDTIDSDEDGIPDDCDDSPEGCEGTIAICPLFIPGSSPTCDYYHYLVETAPKCAFTQLEILLPGDTEPTIISTYTPIGQSNFNWSYCVNLDICGFSTPLQGLVNDLQNWMNQNGYLGTVALEQGVGPNNENRFAVLGTDLEIKTISLTCPGYKTNYNFVKENCEGDTDHYILNPLLSETCEEATYLWSTGETTSTITVENFSLEDYSVTVTCGNGCTYSSKEDYACEVGAECNDFNPCTINDVLTPCCICEGTYSGDDDNDGVCNELDQCPGLNDNEMIDTDGDGVPDICRPDCDEGRPCDDGDVCTNNDVYILLADGSCDCEGTYVGDEDDDGVCDTIDKCPGFPDFIDTDSDGVPDGCGPICVDRSGNELNYCEAIQAIATCLKMDAIPDSEQFLDMRDMSLALVMAVSANPNVLLEGTIQVYGTPTTGMTIVADGSGTDVPAFDVSLIVEDDGITMADADGDKVCDLIDICHGSLDWVDGNLDGLPDGCGCNFSNPLNPLSVALYLQFKFDRTCEIIIPHPVDADLFCTVYGEYDCACDCISTENYDADGDGVCNDIDACHGANDFFDADGDGIPDACDPDDPCPLVDDISIFCPGGNDIPCYLYAYLEYNYLTGDCECVYVPDGDDDGDGVCNIVDACEGFDDSIDIDEDLIPDACDLCPGVPGSLGTPCDDGNECTGNDMLEYIYETTLLSEILDPYPGVFDGISNPLDLQAVIAYLKGPDVVPSQPLVPVSIWSNIYNIFENEGDSYAIMIDGCGCQGFEYDSDNDGVCDEMDACPGFDDNLDYDLDGEPDGCDPPYYEIGCPDEM